MLDGPTELTDLDKTEANRETIRMFVDEVNSDLSLYLSSY
jgi:hypothetical protein